MRWLWVALFACSSPPHAQPTPPHPPATVDAGAGAAPHVSARDCDELVAHAIDLAAAERGSATTTEDIGATRAAMHRDCATLSAAQLQCGLAAKTAADLESCDGPLGSAHAQ